MLMICVYCSPLLIEQKRLKEKKSKEKYLSSKHPNINFSLEKENDSRLSFLDINIFREKRKFATNVYQQKTFSGVYTNFNSFMPETYKTGLIESRCSDGSICVQIFGNSIMK